MRTKNIIYISGIAIIAVIAFISIHYYVTTHSSNTMQTLVDWVIAHGYFLFFVAAFLEGPLITAAAGVACALGYYSIEIIIVLSILGDLCPDAVFYTVGYFGGRPLIDRYGKYVGMTAPRVKKLEQLLRLHLRKTITAVKLAPLIPVPGIIVIGSLRAPIKTFMETALLITVPKSLLFALVGYYSGKAYQHINNLVTNSEVTIFALAIVMIAVFLLYQKVTFSISDKMEDLS